MGLYAKRGPFVAGFRSPGAGRGARRAATRLVTVSGLALV